MVTRMFSVVFKQFQIFNAVVLSVSIDMMNHLSRFKGSAKMFFHNKTMNRNGPVLMAKRVIFNPNAFISDSRFSAFPQPAFYASLGQRLFFSCFRRNKFSSLREAKALFGAKLSFFLIGQKRLFTKRAEVFSYFNFFSVFSNTFQTAISGLSSLGKIFFSFKLFSANPAVSQ